MDFPAFTNVPVLDSSFELLFPFLAMMALTIAVWAFMYARRLSYMFANGIAPQEGATPEKMAALFPESVQLPANNLKNLFEMPVLFYALCIALMATHRVDNTFMTLAWAYVFLRAAHSAVHCTVNHVATRFTFYILSCFVLFAMIARFALSL